MSLFLKLLKRTIAIVTLAIGLAYGPVLVCIIAGLLYKVIPIPINTSLLLLVSGAIYFLTAALLICWGMTGGPTDRNSIVD